MKTIFEVMLLLSIMAFVSCKNDVPAGHQNTSGSLTGQWQWVATYNDAPLSASNPSTPQNTGINELLVLDSSFYWQDVKNGIISDSGKYNIGHAIRTIGITRYEYDSICYYKNGLPANTNYYSLSHDTLLFNPAYAGLIGGSEKIWIRKY
jgi:hypothetical protein